MYIALITPGLSIYFNVRALTQTELSTHGQRDLLKTMPGFHPHRRLLPLTMLHFLKSITNSFIHLLWWLYSN